MTGETVLSRGLWAGACGDGIPITEPRSHPTAVAGPQSRSRDIICHTQTLAALGASVSRLRHGEGILGWGCPPPEGARVAYALDHDLRLGAKRKKAKLSG